MLKSLSECKRLDECKIYLFSDGPKNRDDWTKVRATRDVLDEWALQHDAEKVYNGFNHGCGATIYAGITSLCRQYGRVVAVEDDLLLSPGFLDYMLTALYKYEDYPRVYQVSGYSHIVTGDDHAYFTPVAASWGWATWQRAWSKYDLHPALERVEDPYGFNLDGAMDYTYMLRETVAGHIDTWDIQWYYTIRMNNGLVVYPPSSLTYNFGWDVEGTHCTGKDVYQPGIDEWQNRQADTDNIKYPVVASVDAERLRQVKKHLLARRPQLPAYKKIYNRIRGIV